MLLADELYAINFVLKPAIVGEVDLSDQEKGSTTYVVLPVSVQNSSIETNELLRSTFRQALEHLKQQEPVPIEFAAGVYHLEETIVLGAEFSGFENTPLIIRAET